MVSFLSKIGLKWIKSSYFVRILPYMKWIWKYSVNYVCTQVFCLNYDINWPDYKIDIFGCVYVWLYWLQVVMFVELARGWKKGYVAMT